MQLRRLVPCAALLAVAAAAAASDEAWLPTPSVSRWDAEHGFLPDWGWSWSGWARAGYGSGWAPAYGGAWSPSCRLAPPACGVPWWQSCPPEAIEAPRQPEEPTVIVREPGRYEQVGDTEVWVPDAYTTLPAGVTTRHARRHGGEARAAPDERERSADR